jgi:ABC-2 type transport system ATP-binding protein
VKCDVTGKAGRRRAAAPIAPTLYVPCTPNVRNAPHELKTLIWQERDNINRIIAWGCLHLDAIITSNLTKSFQEMPLERPALSDLNLRIKAGTVFGFLGPNGAGKTTTIRLLLGLLSPSAGSAEVLGWSVEREAAHIRERVGVLLEHHGLYERLSAYDNLAYFADIYHLETRVKEQRIKDLLGSIGCWERRHEKAGNWSKGMKQKLAIARALIHDPELVFLDEPTSGLDPAAAHQLRDELLELVRHAGKTIFITTHNLEEAEKICDQVGVIDHGHLLAVGSPSELRGQFSRSKVIIIIEDHDHDHGAAKALTLLESFPGVHSVALQSTGLHPAVPNPIAQQSAAVPHSAAQCAQYESGSPESSGACQSRQSSHLSRLSIELTEPDPNIVPNIIRALVAADIAIQEVHQEKASLEDVFLSLTKDAGRPEA